MPHLLSYLAYLNFTAVTEKREGEIEAHAAADVICRGPVRAARLSSSSRSVHALWTNLHHCHHLHAGDKPLTESQHCHHKHRSPQAPLPPPEPRRRRTLDNLNGFVTDTFFTSVTLHTSEKMATDVAMNDYDIDFDLEDPMLAGAQEEILAIERVPVYHSNQRCS
jgi:hypothetical protein